MALSFLFTQTYYKGPGVLTGAPCEVEKIMVSSSHITTIEPKDLFLRVLPRIVQRAFLACTKLSFLTCSGWYLAGGTALALQGGHRKSVDLDFFTTEAKFPESLVERELQSTNYWKTTYREAGTIYGTFMEAKMSLIAYPFFIPSEKKLCCGTIKILLLSDVASMKILAISQRGRKRDFVDLYWYCTRHELLDLVIYRAIKQYPGQENNIPHILKSLTYFADADNEPMPPLFFKATWREIKNYFEREIPRITRKLLDLK